ncbi:MAG: c-type cytochrome, partial [Halothiobacillus sp.]
MNRLITLASVAALFAMSTSSFANEQGKSIAKADKPSTEVAWTPETMALVRSGNVQKGGQLANEQMCASCHGHAGIAQSNNWPSLAGQRAEYTYKMLQDYKNGSRNTYPLMTALAKPMSDQDMADIAAFYASFKLPPVPEGTPIDKALADKAELLVMKGDGNRLLAPCMSCHGYKGEGDVVDIPAMAGQTPEYFIRTMQDYKAGKRSDDVYSRMRLVAHSLSDQEIIELANYYANLT